MDDKPMPEIDTLLITPDYYPSVGGVARYLASYVKKHNLEVLAGDPDFKDEMEAGSPRFELEAGVFRKNLLWPLWPKWLPLLLWSMIYSRHYKKIVVSHILPVGYAALLAKKPYVVILHGLDIINAGKSKWKKYWAKKILGRAEKIVVNSRATGELLLKIFGEGYKYEVEYPAIAPLSAPSKNLKEKYGLQGKKIILSLGRLVKRKGQEKIIRLMPKILQEEPDAVFVVAGGGAEKAKLENLAQSFGIADKVLFLGKARESELPDIYNMADIFTAPSLPSKEDWEGFGMVCLEAAYFAKPVIVTNVGGLPEAIENGATGYVVKDDEELYKKIIELFKNNELAKKMGEAGKKRVEEKFLIR